MHGVTAPVRDVGTPRRSVPPSPSSALRASPRYSGAAVLSTDLAAGQKQRDPDRHCRFGSVQVMTHAPRLDASKVPTEGPGLGLGELLCVSMRRLDSFEERRERERHGVRRSSPEDRRRTIGMLHRSESIDLVERECKVAKRQRAESAAEKSDDSGGEERIALAEIENEGDEIGLTDLWG